jgi:hypothetical protein
MTNTLRSAVKRRRDSSDKEMQMFKIGRMTAVIAIAALALPAAAGSWPNLPTRKAPANASQPAPAKSPIAIPPQSSVNGFEYAGGEAGWQLSPHKFVWSEGRFVHSDECDHAIRTAKAPTPAELESTRALYPGA